MPTRNIVPRADNEGQLGRNNLHWFKAFLNNLEVTGDIEASITSNLTVGSSSVLLSDVVSVINGDGVGEVNTASNEGSSGIGVFKTKTGTNLEFKNLTAVAGSGLSLTDDTGNDEIDLALDINGQTIKTSISSSDEFIIYDSLGGIHKKVLASTVMTGGSGATNITHIETVTAGSFLPVSGSIYEEGSPDVNGVDNKVYIEIDIPSGVTNPKYFMLNILDSQGWGIQPHAYRYEGDDLSSPSVPKIVIYFWDDTIAPIDVSVNFING